MKYASPGSRLSVYHNFTESVGYGVLRGSTDVYQCHRVGVVIEFTRYNGKPYFILSAFLRDKPMKTSELDNLIVVYFGQDYDLINAEGDITALIAEYIRLATHQQREALVNELDELLAQDNVESLFNQRFGFTFSPELWGTTVSAFLQQARSAAVKAL